MGCGASTNQLSTKPNQFVNWGETIRVTPYKWFKPNDEAGLKKIITEAVKNKKKIRAVGSGHSWSPMWPETDEEGANFYFVDTSLLNTIVVDEKNKQFEIGPGVTIEALKMKEIEHKMAMPTNAVLTSAFWGGLISTASHGAGREEGTMSDAVVSIEFVTWDPAANNGSGAAVVKKFSKDDTDKGFFKAALCHLGTFGLINKIRLQAKPMYTVHVIDKKYPIRDVLDIQNPQKLKDLIYNNDFIQIFWWPLNKQGELWVKTFNKVDNRDKPTSIEDPCKPWEVIKAEFKKLALQFVKGTSFLNEDSTPTLASALHELIIEEDYYTELPNAIHFQPYLEYVPKLQDSEVCIELTPDCSNMVEAYLSIINQTEKWAANKKFPINTVVESRVIGHSQALLSAAYGEPQTLHAYLEVLAFNGTPDYDEFAQELFIPWMKEKNWKARPHLGKYWQNLHNNSFDIYQYVATHFGFSKFEEFRKQVDPTGLFLTKTLQKLCNPVELLEDKLESLQADAELIEKQLDEEKKKAANSEPSATPGA